jgi:1-acyl-sn-glycerol-3-phosphate acyltransferase
VRRKRLRYQFVQWFLRCMGRFVWKVQVEGRERIPREGALIVAPTHESFLDPMVVGAYLPRDLRYMARRTLFVKKREDGTERRRLLASAFARWAWVIEVDRDAGGRDAVRKCLERLEAGEAVLLFPEGTRSLDGNVREFEPGVGLIALRSGAPVLPISIEGSRRVWGKGRKLPRLGAGPVRLVFGEPVKYERPTRAEDVAADLRRRILDLRGAGRIADARDGADAHGVAGGGRSS